MQNNNDDDVVIMTKSMSVDLDDMDKVLEGHYSKAPNRLREW